MGAYSQTRAKRSLQWKRAHGLVEVTVQLADRALSLVVTPVHLAVLECFSGERDENTCGVCSGAGASTGDAPTDTGSKRLGFQEVAALLGLPEAITRKRIGFWVSKGVLREVSAGVFEVQEHGSAADPAAAGHNAPGAAGDAEGGHHLDEDSVNSPQPGTTTHQRGDRDATCAVELEACEGLIQGMLTNYKALPLARIQHFLQMFMRDPPYTQTESQLRNFLTKLCQEGRLEFNGSDYSLARQG